jgi:hypothetical protein
VRTTIRLNDRLLAETKKIAADTGRSLTSVIEDALREVISRRKAAPGRISKINLPVFKGRGLRPGVDLDNSAALLDLMDKLS